MGDAGEPERFEARLARLIDDRSKRKVAHDAGLSYAGLDKLLAGGVRSPKAETIVALARVLGVTPDYLRYGIGQLPAINTLEELLAAVRVFLETEVERQLTERLEAVAQRGSLDLEQRAQARRHSAQRGKANG